MNTLNSENKKSGSKCHHIFTRSDIAACSIFLVLAVVFIWRARRGFSIPDEAGQITAAHRYILGEGLLSDEWHVAQFMAFIEYLPMKLYMLFTGGTQGVILFFRYVYIIFQFAVSITAYMLLRKKYGYFSILICVLNMLSVSSVLLFSYSYYAIYTDLFFLACVVACEVKSKKLIACVASGVFIALAVTCYPPFAVIYFIYAIFYFTNAFILRTEKKPISFGLLTKNTFIAVTLGVVTTAVVFLIFLLHQTSPGDILNNFKYLFIDTEHVQCITRLKNTFGYLIKGIVWLVPFIAVSIVISIDKKREKRKLTYLIFCLCIIAVEAILFSIIYLQELAQLQFIMYPLLFLNVPLMLLNREHLSDLFKSTFFCGCMMCICNWVASGKGYFAAAAGLNLCCVSAVLLINDTLKDYSSEINLKKQKNVKNRKKTYQSKSVTALIAVLMVCLCVPGTVCIIKAPSYFEGTAESLSSICEKGPYRGIYTTSKRLGTYNKLLNDIEFINTKSDGRIFVTDALAWLYIYDNKPYGSFSSWILEEYLKDDARVKLYYEKYSENLPAFVYIPKANRFSFELSQKQGTLDCVQSIFVSKLIKETEVGYILEVDSIR